MSYPFSDLLEGVELAKQTVGTNLAIKGARYKRYDNRLRVWEYRGKYTAGQLVSTWNEWYTAPDAFVVFDSYILATRPTDGEEVKCTSIDDEA